VPNVAEHGEISVGDIFGKKRKKRSEAVAFVLENKLEHTKEGKGSGKVAGRERKTK
jgi:hypothetical protein